MLDYQSVSDEELVHNIRTTNQELYEHIVERYQNKLFQYVRYLIHDDQKAADVVQQTLINAYINLQGFNTKKKFSSWIYRIAHNESMNAIKRYRKELSIPEEFDIPSLENIEDDFTRKEIVDRAHRCLGKLAPKYAEPLTLHYLQDKSYDEISDILHLPPGTVATRLRRGKVALKHICQKNV